MNGLQYSYRECESESESYDIPHRSAMNTAPALLRLARLVAIIHEMDSASCTGYGEALKRWYGRVILH